MPADLPSGDAGLPSGDAGLPIPAPLLVALIGVAVLAAGSACIPARPG